MTNLRPDPNDNDYKDNIEDQEEEQIDFEEEGGGGGGEEEEGDEEEFDLNVTGKDQN